MRFTLVLYTGPPECRFFGFLFTVYAGGESYRIDYISGGHYDWFMEILMLVVLSLELYVV